MKLIALFITSLGLLGLLNGIAGSAAELPKVRSDQPIQIKSNELSSDTSGKVATFTGSVVARQGDVTIFCDTLIVHYDAEESDISKVEALGNVRVVQGNRQGFSGRAKFDNQAGTIVMEDNPKVRQGSDTVSGKVITFYLNEDKSVVTGGSDHRVEAVINPKGAGINVGSKP